MSERPPVEEPVPAFEDVPWIVTEIEGQAVDPLPGYDRPTVRFASPDDQGHRLIRGHGGINGFGGRYTRDDNQLQIPPLMTTRMGGPPDAMKLEGRFLLALRAANRYRIDTKGLTLLADTTADDGSTKSRQVLRLVRQPVVTVTVRMPGGVKLPKHAVLTVTLGDSSDGSETVAHTRQRAERAETVTLQLPYDPARIDAERTYHVKAEIQDRGKPILSHERAHPVITQGHGHRTEITITTPAP